MTDMYQEILQQFDETSLPDLDDAVLGALELFAQTSVPSFSAHNFKRPLVLGSGNALVVGQVLFDECDAIYADESSYERVYARHATDIDSAVIISASGGKDAVAIAESLQKKQLSPWLLTTNSHAPSGRYIDPTHTVLFPKNREPYTYNVSTYMGMLLSKTHEDPRALVTFITDTVATAIPSNLGDYDAFYFIVPPQCIALKDMFLTKFDELFGSRVSARVFTTAQSRHGKTVVPSDTECFISLGEENTLFGSESARLSIPLPEHADAVAYMAIGYYIIGQIQKQHPSYFKENIVAYAQKASELFGETITPIVS